MMDIKVGDLVTYLPRTPPGAHFPAVIERIGKRVKIRVFKLSADVKFSYLSTTKARLIVGQMDMFSLDLARLING